MRSPLRKLFLAPAIMVAAAVATSTAMAENQLNVPFSFMAAGKMCPAGVYDVDQGPALNTVRLVSEDSSRNFVWIVAPGSPLPTDQRIVLTFDNFGSTHALHSVQFRNKITSRLDKPSKEYVPSRIVAGQ
ncbi:MAG TPA: hypothetical protein VMD92_17955 [Acidobacteriaceae bacterium]|jgi:hypothetical protein|nr:hypothetical protein [Acidobacteriaceae bacterium]